MDGKSIHPSLHFKCINTEEDVWAVRVTLGFRSVGILEGDTVTWFWIVAATMNMSVFFRDKTH